MKRKERDLHRNKRGRKRNRVKRERERERDRETSVRKRDKLSMFKPTITISRTNRKLAEIKVSLSE
jgi:hypothetical protein